MHVFAICKEFHSAVSYIANDAPSTLFYYVMHALQDFKWSHIANIIPIYMINTEVVSEKKKKINDNVDDHSEIDGTEEAFAFPLNYFKIMAVS